MPDLTWKNNLQLGLTPVLEIVQLTPCDGDSENYSINTLLLWGPELHKGPCLCKIFKCGGFLVWVLLALHLYINRVVHSFKILTNTLGASKAVEGTGLLSGHQSCPQYSHRMGWERDKQTNTNSMFADVMTEDSFGVSGSQPRRQIWITEEPFKMVLMFRSHPQKFSFNWTGWWPVRVGFKGPSGWCQCADRLRTVV